MTQSRMECYRGEPVISIGHNEYGAWGLTVFRTDGEDLYIYDIDPKNPNRYKYLNRWEDFVIVKDSISVKGEEDRIVKLKYSRHGPVTFTDTKNNKAYAVRSAWLEVGGAPYLASLRMNQAKDWAEFKMACHYSHIPGENMIWADKVILDGKLLVLPLCERISVECQR